MSWLVTTDQFRQLSLLRRRHKVKANLQCTDEAQNKVETRVCTLLAPCKEDFFIFNIECGADGMLLLLLFRHSAKSLDAQD